MQFRFRLPSSGRSLFVGALWIIGGGLLIGGVFGLSFYLSLRGALSSTEVQVPDFHGQTMEQAEQTATAGALVLQIVDRRSDPAMPSGQVLQQTPSPGAKVRRGRKVKLVLSSGSRVLVVPDLVGGAARTVRIDLNRQGFAPGEEARVASAQQPTGRILAQVPAAETKSVPNERIHVLVSNGPPVVQWVMPDLTGLPADEAERWIAALGFRRGAVRRVSMGDRPSGYVVGQLPLAGYPIRSKDVVELTVVR